jgi:hypothetical protein
MSARILLEQKLRLVEVPMSYSERVGRSKLSVVWDGVRFLTVILRAAMCYRPSRPLLVLAAMCGGVAALIVAGPSWFYARNQRLEEWMIYRVLLSSLLATWCALLLCAACMAEHISAATLLRPLTATGVTGMLVRWLRPRPRMAVAGLLSVVAVVLVWPGVVEYLGTGHVQMHWSRAVLASLLMVVVAMLWITGLVISMVTLIQAQRVQSRRALADYVKAEV